MERTKIQELLDAALDIIDGGNGVDGYPFVRVSVSNYYWGLEVHVMDTGFDQGKGFDGAYSFGFDIDTAEEMDVKYAACMAHLSRLRKGIANGRQA